jgi:hypothetical protein
LIALIDSGGEWWTADAEAEFSNSGESGTLSRLAEIRKIAVKSAINFEYLRTRFKRTPFLS